MRIWHRIMFENQLVKCLWRKHFIFLFETIAKKFHNVIYFILQFHYEIQISLHCKISKTFIKSRNNVFKIDTNNTFDLLYKQNDIAIDDVFADIYDIVRKVFRCNDQTRNKKIDIRCFEVYCHLQMLFMITRKRNIISIIFRMCCIVFEWNKWTDLMLYCNKLLLQKFFQISIERLHVRFHKINRND